MRLTVPGSRGNTDKGRFKQDRTKQDEYKNRRGKKPAFYFLHKRIL